jgi:two-component system, chemotaxis family, protein-glutamate methylesterase/glutaminase
MRARFDGMATRDIIVIAASQGGPEAVSSLLSQLPAELPASLFVVIHTHPTSPGLLPQMLRRATVLPVSAATAGLVFERGHVYVAPPDRHLFLEMGTLRLSHGPKENYTRPAADPLFRSAAEHHGPRVIGVVLTGGDGDGTAGARAIKRHGGLVIVQEPGEARNPNMPRHALLRADPDFRLPLTDIPAVLMQLVRMPIGSLPVSGTVRLAELD